MQFIGIRKLAPLAVALGLLLSSADSFSQVKPKESLINKPAERNSPTRNG